MTTLSVLALFPKTEDEINFFVYRTVRAVEAGEITPLEVQASLKKFEKASKEIVEKIKDQSLIERKKYPEKVAEIYGCRVEVAELATRYDYKACNDNEWNELDITIKELEAKKKEREQFLRNLSRPLTMADEGTGEIVTINPPIKSSTTGLKFSI